MQRKPGFPVTNCNIKMPDCSPNLPNPDNMLEDDHEQHQRRQQLINYGHSQWGFNNWSWSVTKQELDFIDFNNGKYYAGVVAFVSIKVKSFDIYRENIGYATSFATTKGFAIYKSRKCAVTNALRETLLSFGGSVAADLIDLLENKTESVLIGTESHSENNLNIANRAELKPSPVKPRKEGAPVARAQPMLAALPPRAPPPAPQPVPAPPVRPNSNVSFVLQPLQMYAPRLAPPPVGAPVFPNYYECSGPWHFAYESYDRSPPNVNLNFGMPAKNLVVGGRPPEPNPPQGCWIKPTIFYDGFWTEQKVKKWVAEQVEKRFPDDAGHKSTSPGDVQPESKS
ncbi:uncharacterized protein LOC114250416 isoform X1 [Bombyx mandarina]|uniref:Uncharacterized protein LOC114250416 isoform X1 n=1 Tax=Bombyx mandarina TaxID=7092 RepID=A0A6J2KER2_BOMMA|nr:uncharacterized protein LOC114250416 isoform X1 [Bombyx mandarina]